MNVENDNIENDNIENEDNIEQYFEKYIICKNLNNKLKKRLGYDTFDNQKNINWIPPDKSGLGNSEPIIQKYFIDKLNNITQINYIVIIKDDIRNMRSLNEEQLKYITTLNKNQLCDIVNTFNVVNKYLVELIDK